MKQSNFHSKSATLILNKINNYILCFEHILGNNDSVSNMGNRAIIENICNGIIHDSFNCICPDGLPKYMRSVFLDLYIHMMNTVKSKRL